MDGVATGLSRALMTAWGGTGGPKGGEGTASIPPAPKVASILLAPWVARGRRASCSLRGSCVLLGGAQSCQILERLWHSRNCW